VTILIQNTALHMQTFDQIAGFGLKLEKMDSNGGHCIDPKSKVFLKYVQRLALIAAHLTHD
jgi:hypothetical protein